MILRSPPALTVCKCHSCSRTVLYTHASRHTHTHIHADTRVPTEHREGSLIPAGGPSCSELPDPPLPTHSCTPPLSLLYLLHTHWVHCAAPVPGQTPLMPPKGQPLLVEFQVPGLVTSKDGRRASRKAGEAVHQPAGGRWAAERPHLAGSLQAHLGEQKQWWLLLSSASFPQAQPQIQVS